MKGVILAGGTGSRLYPLTKVTNKHLLPVGNQPMIFYPVQKLIQAGITDILIVTGVEHMGDVVSLLGSGKDFQCQFTYRVQDEAGGIAQALLLAEDFTQGGPMTVILGDNIFQSSLKEALQSFQSGAHVFLKEVPDPDRFGVATVENGQVTSIIEKPSHPQSNLAVTGIYLYDHQVFDIIRNCKPSGRGELEISDVNANYLAQSQVTFSILDGWWSDAGTFSSLAKASDLVKNHPLH
jgi:glucose-1-phosphate thymidylyltransferase